MKTVLIAFTIGALIVPSAVRAQSGKPEVLSATTVEEKRANSIKVKDARLQETRELPIDPTTRIIGQNRKLLRLDQVKPNDTLYILNRKHASGSADARKINKIYVKDASASAQSKRRAVSGVITAAEGNLLTLGHLIQTDRTYKVRFTALTLITAKETKLGSAALLTLGTRIAAVGELGADGAIVAKRIHVIPGAATGAMRRFASPSGSPVPSQSATPAVTGFATTPGVTPAESALPSDTPTPIPTTASSPIPSPTP